MAWITVTISWFWWWSRTFVPTSIWDWITTSACFYLTSSSTAFRASGVFPPSTPSSMNYKQVKVTVTLIWFMVNTNILFYFNKMISNTRVPAQVFGLQVLEMNDRPLQKLPPPEGTGWLQKRLLTWLPVPQLFVQDEYSPHSLQPPFTIK